MRNNFAPTLGTRRFYCDWPEISAAEGNGAGAIQYLKQAVQSDPKNPDARLELGRALYDSGDVDGAIRETTQAA